MSKAVLVKALADHYGHRNWTLIEDHSVQLDGEDEIISIASLGIDALLDECATEYAALVAKRSRAEAYKTEADPLFFKAQRGEATIEEWEAKVAEIRARYPYTSTAIEDTDA
jgi:hypothetical protein